MKKFILATAALLAVGCGSANATPSLCDVAAGNLIHNCGFETGSLTNWIATPAASGSDFGVGGVAHSGAFGAFFGDTASQYDQIFQGVPTTPGDRYELSYYFQSDGGVPNAGFVGWYDGTFHVLGGATNIPAFSWILEDFSFVATTNTTGIDFGAYDGPGYLTIDDVVLRDIGRDVSVPEPFTLGIFGAGLAGAIAMRRRKHKPA